MFNEVCALTVAVIWCYISPAPAFCLLHRHGMENKKANQR